MRTGRCERCDATFTDRSRPQSRRFCSDHCRKRSYEEDLSNRRMCPECGGTMGVHAYRKEDARCDDCWRAAQKAVTSERGHLIEQWWAEGLTVREIGVRLGGWSKSKTGVAIAHLRNEGFDIPHRRSPEQVQRIKDGWARVRKNAA